MIWIYEQGYEDFSTNGLGKLIPTKCEISEEQAGAYELEMSHPMDEGGIFELLKAGRVIKAPVPAQTTPLIHMEAAEGYEIWETTARAKVYTKKTTSMGSAVTVTVPAEYDTTYIRPETVILQEEYTTTKWQSNGNRVLETLDAGTLVNVLSKSGSWYRVTTENGNTGWAQANKVTLIATIPSAPPETIQARKTREQLFRIYRTEKDTETGEIRVWARHISYDLLANVIIDCNLKDVAVGSAIAALNANCTQQDHGFAVYTNSSKTITADYSRTGFLEAILDPDEGIAALANLRVVRDNYDIFLLERSTTARQPITYGQNLMGVTVDINEDGIINRIVPVGRTKDGEPLYIDSIYTDSPRNNEATVLRAGVIEYNVEEREAKDGEPAVTLAQAKAKLLELAQEDFESGLDLPDISVRVEFIQLGDTEEYQQYRDLDRLYLGDIVSVNDEVHQVLLDAEVTKVDYDAIAERYLGMEVGVTDARRTIGSLGSFVLPNGGLGGRKIVMGGVDGSRFQNLSIGGAKIANGTIETAKIKDAQITNAKIANGTIETAKIKDGQITTAKIADAQITNAKIAAAGIDFAKLKDMVAGTAIITEGVGGKLYIARLAVTEANMVSLTVGEMIVKGSDGRFYTVVPDGQGGVTTQLKQVVGNDVANNTIAGGKLIENTITARELNVSSIFADTALIRAIKAANIDVADLFAAQATITELDAYIIKASTITALKGQLDVWAQNKIDLTVGNIQVGGTNMVPYSNSLMDMTKWRDWGDQATFTQVHDVVQLTRPVGSTTPIAISSREYIRFVTGVEYMLSFNYAPYYTDSVPINWVKIYSNSELIGLPWGNIVDLGLSTDKYSPTGYIRRKALLFTVPRNIDDGNIIIGCNPPDPATRAEGFRISKIKIEQGNKATPWSPHPADPGAGIKNSSVEINQNGIFMDTTGEFSTNAAVAYNVRGGSGANFIGISNNETNNHFLWAGNQNPSLAPFAVTKDGKIRATKIQQEYAQSFWDMADASFPAEFPVYIPSGYTIDSVEFTFQTKKARTFAKSASSTTVAYSTQASSSYVTGSASPTDPHSHSIGPHTHVIPSQSHGHSLNYGINEKSALATSCALKVGTTTIGTYSPDPSAPVEIKSSMAAGWNTITVQPNNDARIIAFVLVKITPA